MSESPNDQKIAAEWVKVIEDPSALNIREQDIYPRLTKWVDKVSPSQILEIGCGQGICSSVLNLQKRNYTGVDPSHLLIERAQKLYADTNKNFIIGTAETLPFESSSFDAAFSIAVWHLLENLELVTQELARILKPNGSFLIISANPDAYSLWSQPYESTSLEGHKLTGKMRLNDGSLATETLFLHSRTEIVDTLRNTELSVDSVDVFRQVDQDHRFIHIEGRRD